MSTKQANEREVTILMSSRPCHPTMVQGFIVSERTMIETCVSDTYDSLRRSEIYFCGMYLLTSRLPVQRKALWPLN